MLSNNKVDAVISIVIPCFNYGKFIEEAIESCLSSTFQSIEIIVVNDGSTDPETISLLERLNHPKIRVIHQENRGLPGARNRGFKEAKGKYIFPLDADDKIHPTLLEKGYWILERFPEIGFVTSWLKHFGNEDWIWSPPAYNFYYLLKENNIVGNSLIRKEAWEEVDGYNEAMTSGYEDWDFWIKLSDVGWIGYQIKEPLFYYRKHGVTLLQEANAISHKLEQQIRDNHPHLYREENLCQFKKEWSNYSPDLSAPLPWNCINPYLTVNSKKDINLLIVMPWLEIGGAERYVLDIVRGLDKNKFQITIVTTLPSLNPWSEEFEGITNDIFHFPHYLLCDQMEEAVFQLIKTRDIDLVHIHNSELGYAMLPELKRRYPNITTVSQMHSYVPSLPWDYVRKAAAMNAFIDKHVVVKPSLKDLLIHKFHVAEEKIMIIPNGVDIDAYIPLSYEQRISIIEKFQIDKEDIVISFIGRLAEDKEPIGYVEVCIRLANMHPDLPLRFLIIGDGPQKNMVLSKIDESGLDHLFCYLGFRSDIHELLSISDVLLCTSHSEGLPFVGQEAMATGTPVIAFDVQGWNELLEDRKTGLLVEPFKDETQSMANAVSELIGDKDLENSVRKNAREKIVNEYSLQQFHFRMEAFYNQIV